MFFLLFCLHDNINNLIRKLTIVVILDTPKTIHVKISNGIFIPT
jgi:hypothetical protein